MYLKISLWSLCGSVFKIFIAWPILILKYSVLKQEESFERTKIDNRTPVLIIGILELVLAVVLFCILMFQFPHSEPFPWIASYLSIMVIELFVSFIGGFLLGW